ncbi:hypothetical protein [Egbenema bharatensis]|uniref:hypothetical protein n=1 Tax=Egbenema bharatensis TaxID=3463334 RepID=UPI003A8B7A92
MTDRLLAGKMPALRQSIPLHQWDVPAKTCPLTPSGRTIANQDSPISPPLHPLTPHPSLLTPQNA